MIIISSSVFHLFLFLFNVIASSLPLIFNLIAILLIIIILSRAFRRLLFMDDPDSSSSKKNSTTTSTTPSTTPPTTTSLNSLPPKKEKLSLLPYIHYLRPSSLLGHLVSCSPSQLSSPYVNSNNPVTTNENDRNSSLLSYIDNITIVTNKNASDANDNSNSNNQSNNQYDPVLFPSVISLYAKQIMSGNE